MFLRCQAGQLCVSVHDRAFVGGDGVHAALQGGAQVADGRLTALVVDRRVFKQHIRRDAGDEIWHRCGGWNCRQRADSLPFLRAAQRLRGVNPFGVNGHPMVPGGDTCHLGRKTKFSPQALLFAFQQCHQRLADVTKPHKRHPDHFHSRLLCIRRVFMRARILRHLARRPCRQGVFAEAEDTGRLETGWGFLR